ncbi:MAG: hypothetical protein IJ740_08165 [Ruminococcus sp.]|nr:hypothetical protein [Ruminococcus sp.]
MEEKYEHYFDGISPEKQAHFDSLTIEELEAEIEAEKKKCEEMTDW